MSNFSIKNYDVLVNTQRAFFNTNQTKNIKFRKQTLKKFLEVLLENEDELYEAIYKDFKKPKFEVYETELGPLFSEIKVAINEVEYWAERIHVPTNLISIPSSSYIIPEPLGVSLVISAWNYPYLLSLHPVISAISAGNTVILKPSEIAPNSSALMAKLINNNFDSKLLHAIEGGIPESTALLKQKFDKIFYTGSTAVGKIIYRAAAEHLTPVTLELGGKNPGFVLADANVKIIAQRIVWGKFINAGQTCVAPDYLLVDETIKKKLIIEIKKQITKIHGPNTENSETLARIINSNHFDRLIALIDNEKVIIGGTTNRDKLYISPTVMDNVSFEDKVMQDEIFGPILPIISFTDLDWAIQQVKSRPKPLALYTFTESKNLKNKILDSISFGGGAVNDTVVQLGNHNLPFGGVGESGTGNYHGKFGFDNFSHQKAVLDRSTWFEPNFKYPPYSNWKFNFLKKIF